MDCTFCDINEISYRTILEDEHCFVIPAKFAIVPGHVLVFPKRHVASFEELTAEELQAIHLMTTRLKPALQKAFEAEGFNHAWNEGKMAGQSVPHFHLHVLPRKTGDTGIYEYEPRKYLYRPGEREGSDEVELEGIGEYVKNFLR